MTSCLDVSHPLFSNTLVRDSIITADVEIQAHEYAELADAMESEISDVWGYLNVNDSESASSPTIQEGKKKSPKMKSKAALKKKVSAQLRSKMAGGFSSLAFLVPNLCEGTGNIHCHYSPFVHLRVYEDIII